MNHKDKDTIFPRKKARNFRFFPFLTLKNAVFFGNACFVFLFLVILPLIRRSRPEESSLGRVIDSPALTGTPSQRGKDSLEEYYERMMRWRVLHGGMSKWESDK